MSDSKIIVTFSISTCIPSERTKTMDMNISISANANKAVLGTVDDTGVAAAAHAKPTAKLSDNLTIKSAEPSAPGEIQSIDFPDEDAARNDKLGQLVNAAFSLPPPPPPNFL